MGYTNLDTRMKDYEHTFRSYLPKKQPLIIRLDGKAFHTFTKGFGRPFDDIFMETMQDVTKYLCKNIMNCKFGYTQSDEISLLLVDYENTDTQQWFGNNLQKIVSVSASMATLQFNKRFREIVTTLDESPYFNDNLQNYSSKFDRALFDSRAFILPKEEVCNYFIWRQQDATRNSILSVAQSKLSHKEMDKKNCKELQYILLTEHDLNWNDIEITKKRGSGMVKRNYDKDGTLRSGWFLDDSIPIFTEDRDYIDQHIFEKGE